jgi:hypothetical protein
VTALQLVDGVLEVAPGIDAEDEAVMYSLHRPRLSRWRWMKHAHLHGKCSDMAQAS